jgi:hypothetical protein
MERKYVTVKNKDGSALKRLSNITKDDVIIAKHYSEIEEIVTENEPEKVDEPIEIKPIGEEIPQITAEDDLYSKSIKELKQIAKDKGILKPAFRKVSLVQQILMVK